MVVEKELVVGVMKLSELVVGMMKLGGEWTSGGGECTISGGGGRYLGTGD